MKAKEITAIVKYYDMTMCNLQYELNVALKQGAKFKLDTDKLEVDLTAAVTGFKSDTELLRLELAAATSSFDRLKVANNATQKELSDLRTRLDPAEAKAADFDRLLTKYINLDQLHLTAVTGFKSDTELLRLELAAAKEERNQFVGELGDATAERDKLMADTDALQLELAAAKKEAKGAKQEVVYLGDMVNTRDTALSCMTVDAVAHCRSHDPEALRALINWMKENAKLSIHDRVQLDSIANNIGATF